MFLVKTKFTGIKSKSTDNFVHNGTVVEAFASDDYDVEWYAGKSGAIHEKPKAPPVFLFMRTPTAILSKMTRNPEQSNVAIKKNLEPLTVKPNLTATSKLETESNIKPLPPICSNWLSNK